MANINSNTPACPEINRPFPNLYATSQAATLPAEDLLEIASLWKGARLRNGFFQPRHALRKLISELLECHDVTLSLALVGRLACALEALSAALDRTVPVHLYPSLTTDLSPELPWCIGSEEPILATAGR